MPQTANGHASFIKPDVVGSTGAGDPTAEEVSLLAQKYEEEKAKRLRPEGGAQYDECESSEDARLRRLGDDPWVDHERLNSQPQNLVDGQHVKVVSLGAGLGGLMYTTHLLETGEFRPEDIRLVDAAGGFGGTWYWNRFPGLACDIEASIYLPWLERTGYVPKHRYEYGDDIRRYIETLAEKWGLSSQGVFRTRVDKLTWDEDQNHWVMDLEQCRGPDQVDAIRLTVTAQYVILANGVLNHPKTPKIEGLATFGGAMMHASRWDYGVTGGSPADPRLVGLKGKRVGIVGTGGQRRARTPSSVDVRGQREMSSQEWARITGGDQQQPGWWTRRNINFNEAVNGGEAEQNLIDDGWTRKPRTLTPMSGAPHQPLRMEDIPGHIGLMLAKDAPRSNGLRQRVEELVTDKDKDTVEALKHWYPTWCKRPCFHDNYLQTFNQPHVALVPTDAKGLEIKATPAGLVVCGHEYPLDVLILATGYRSPSHAIAEPSAMSNTPITGRGGRTLAAKWAGADGEEGPGSLHGLFSHGFPNLMLTGPSQQAIAGNVTYVYEVAGRHAAYILASAERKKKKESCHPNDDRPVVVEPSKAAEDAYIHHIASAAAFFAPTVVCLPGYMNDEGAFPWAVPVLSWRPGLPSTRSG
ncbi:hypothetical protein PG999_013133 [Apiospora kogelbergensis]|uniref:FAD/NAD(P)-binding domain-containing protein n=1 Tax=Apiospora kogelbergensis TaxID=1337665 RepID=A0AAW0QBM0_9PEZI